MLVKCYTVLRAVRPRVLRPRTVLAARPRGVVRSTLAAAAARPRVAAVVVCVSVAGLGGVKAIDHLPAAPPPTPVAVLQAPTPSWAQDRIAEATYSRSEPVNVPEPSSLLLLLTAGAALALWRRP